MDLSKLSDAELEAIANGDHDAFLRATAMRQGVRPELAAAVRHQESGGNGQAVSPKGARGQMQLMPGTAADMGVNPDDDFQNMAGGVGYLKRQLDDFGGDEAKALAAYNAGPQAVRDHGGVPPYAETQAYVKAIQARAPDIRGASDAELEAIAGVGAAAPKPTPAGALPGRDRAHPITLTTTNRGGVPEGAFFKAADGVVYQQKRGAGYSPKVPTGADPTIAQDVWAGVSAPFKTLGHDVMEQYRAGQDRLRNPPKPSLSGLLDFSGTARTAGILGDVAGLASAPIQAVVKPTARAINRYGPAPYDPGGVRLQDGKLALAPPRRLQGEEAQAAVEGMLNTALSAARPANVPAPALVKPTPLTLEDLGKVDAANWRKVDASGYRFPQADVQSAAADIRQIVDDAGPELYEMADKVARRPAELAARGDLTPAQANRLRSQIGEKLLKPGSDEASVGRAIQARLDQLIDTGGAGGAASAELKAARRSYMQLSKMRDIDARLTDAQLNKNPDEAAALKPLAKKRGPQRMTNATPDEAAALRRAVTGGPGQKLLRAASAFDPLHSRLGAFLQGVLGASTHGVGSAVTIPVALGATAADRALTARNIQDLLDLVSIGGVKPVAPPPSYSVAGPFVPQPLPNRLLGSGVVAAPLLRTVTGPSRETEASKQARRPQRR